MNKMANFADANASDRHNLIERLEDTTTAKALRGVALFFIILCLVAMPAFFQFFFFTGEEQISIFSAAYGMRLFHPGSNRILAVLPLLTSWLGTPGLIAIGHFLIAVFAVSGGVALFASTLPRSLFYVFAASLVCIMFVMFIGIYSFHFSAAHPYLIPFSFELICCTIALNSRLQGVFATVVFVVAIGALTIASAGINPVTSLLGAVFISMYLAAIYVGRLIDSGPSLPKAAHTAYRLLQTEKAAVVALVMNMAATITIFWLYGWYKRHFPQYVKSNYSIESYVNSGLSIRQAIDAFVYTVEFHANGGAIGLSAPSIVIVIVLLSGFISLALWIARRRINPIYARYYLGAFLLWASAIIVIIVVSQNAHVQLVGNFIRGRYFTAQYYALVLATCLTIAAAAADFFPRARPGSWVHAGKVWLAAGVCLVIGYASYQAAAGRKFTTEIVFRTPSTVKLAEAIREANVSAVLGNYWWIWDLQHELNRATHGTPIVTPVSIRSESLGLNTFAPIVKALARSKSFRFACVEQHNPQPGFDESCASQISFYQAQGGFPLGEINEVSRSDVNEFKITVYELGLAAREDPSQCTPSQVTLRAKGGPPDADGGTPYDIDDDGFVYLQQPMASDRWLLTFSNSKGAEKKIAVAGGAQLDERVLGRQAKIVSDGCRLLVALSRRGGLYPRTTHLVVR